MKSVHRLDFNTAFFGLQCAPRFPVFSAVSSTSQSRLAFFAIEATRQVRKNWLTHSTKFKSCTHVCEGGGHALQTVCDACSMELGKKSAEVSNFVPTASMFVSKMVESHLESNIMPIYEDGLSMCMKDS